MTRLSEYQRRRRRREVALRVVAWAVIIAIGLMLDFALYLTFRAIVG